MRAEWFSPLDPECPGAMTDVYDKLDSMLADPMTSAYGAPVDEFAEEWARKHRSSCDRCQEYGAENIEILT